MIRRLAGRALAWARLAPALAVNAARELAGLGDLERDADALREDLAEAYEEIGKAHATLDRWSALLAETVRERDEARKERYRDRGAALVAEARVDDLVTDRDRLERRVAQLIRRVDAVSLDRRHLRHLAAGWRKLAARHDRAAGHLAGALVGACAEIDALERDRRDLDALLIQVTQAPRPQGGAERARLLAETIDRLYRGGYDPLVGPLP